MEPKSGKLFKLGHGLFGPKWTEKWVHLDGQTLKYFAMAAETQPFFSLSSARQSPTIDLLSTIHGAQTLWTLPDYTHFYNRYPFDAGILE
ncbi:hypothetical protein ATCC90586_011349 [Pythium insidiosum]|nr:hypothetical protein ATCC90586_011349 [Pythium insidiosum]